MKNIGLSLLFILLSGVLAQNDSVKVNSIVFSGNEFFSTGDLLGIMKTTESSFLRSRYFSEYDLNEDINNIITFYKNEGFFYVKIDNYNIHYNEDKTELDISINIIEGKASKINSINFVGNKFYSSEKILENISIKLTDRFQYYELSGSEIILKKMYYNSGFLETEISFNYTVDDYGEKVDIYFNIVENERFIINEIIIKNSGISDPKIIKRELEFESDQFVNLDLLTNSQRNLYRTGLFHSVIVKPIFTPDTSKQKKDILVSLKENDPGEFDISVGYGTIEKLRTSSQVSYDNLLSEAYKASLQGKLSKIEHSIELTLTDPWILGLPIKASFVGAYTQKYEPTYDNNLYEISLNFYKDFSFRSKIGLSANYQINKYENLRFQPIVSEDISENITQEELDIINNILNNLNYIFNKMSAKLTFTHDLRNNLYNPTEGFYFGISSEIIYGTADINFMDMFLEEINNRVIKSEATINFFYPFQKSITFASSFQLGVINNFNPEVPILFLDDLFYAGGPSDLRGFQYKMVGPLNNDNVPVGGQLKFVWNVFEFRYKLFWLFEGVAFFDLGNVWKTFLEFKFKNLRYSPGLGLRMDSPIGLLRFDYGFNPWPKYSESRGQYWIGIGHAF